METPGTHRIRFTLHYDGAAFYGWQLQPRERTVQGEVERVLGRLLNRPARVIGSGRTDRGVHATGQVAAVDVPERWSATELRRAMNALLSPDVWVADAAEVEPRFHPRFDAVERSYRYRVGVDPQAASPFHARWCWSFGRPVDTERIRAATEVIVGDHSFRAFAKAGQEERGDRCIVQRAGWVEWALGLEFHVTANRFLHHMVRYLVGTLVEIGSGKRAPGEMTRLLEPGSGLETSPPAPPQGLFLTRVTYPGERQGDEGSLPTTPQWTRTEATGSR